MSKSVHEDLAAVKLAKPAQRALANAGISSLKELSAITQAELKELHGIGSNAIIALTEALKKHRLHFATAKKNKK